MARLFISLYIGLLSSLFFFSVVAHLINTYWFIDVTNIQEAQHLSNTVKLLEQLKPHLSETRWQQEIKQLENLNQIILQPISKADVPEDILAIWTELPVWMDDEPLDFLIIGSQYYAFYPDNAHPLIEIEDNVDFLNLFALVAIVAISCFIWLYLLQIKLRRIEKTTGELSTGDLSARVSIKQSHKVGKLNQDINTMAERIEQLLSSHKQLSNSIAHELRTPIFRMQLQLEMLRDFETPPQKSYLDGVEQDIYALQDLVDEFLHHAQEERLELQAHVEPVFVKPYFEDFVKRMIQQYDVSFELTLSISSSQVYFDPRLIERALENFCSNAQKYGQGPWHLSARQTQTHLIIVFQDSGLGIPIEQESLIFAPFYRLSDQQHQKGYGLGLSIVKDIAHSHNGTVKLTKGELSGAAFELTLECE